MRPCLLSIPIALALASPAKAEEPQPVAELVVTRLPSLLEDAPDARVIEAEEIALRQATFAADVLTLVPGVSLSRNGAFGGITSVRMRGASADKTLVVIDGVVQNDPSQPTGGYDFAGLDLADVERVEILSGPQGSLWGSDAIGGVIAFTTRSEDGLRASLEGGSYGVVRGTLAAGQDVGAWSAGITAAGYRADGVSKADGFPEADSLRSWTLSGGGRATLGAVTLDGRLRYADTRSDSDGYDPITFAFGDTGEVTTSKSWTGFVRARLDGPWGFRNTLTLGGYDLDRAFEGGPFASRFRATRRDYRWMAERGAPSDRFGIALGVERDATDATLSDGSREDLAATSAFVVGRARLLDRIALTGSLRYDDPDAFGGKATARVGAVAELGWGFALTGDWGQGFKTPTISEIACDFCFPPGPSTGLKPETAEGWDIGLRWRSPTGRLQASVTGYRLAVRDQIAYLGRYVNLDRTLATGMETDLEARLTPTLTLKAAYAYTDAVDRSTGARLLRVPEHAGSASLLWRRDHWSGALTVRAEGEQADSDPSTFARSMRPGFVLADIAAAYRLTGAVELTARIENLADRHYQEALGYGEPGRAVYVGIRVGR
jgi:vitamin B12 transporter